MHYNQITNFIGLLLSHQIILSSVVVAIGWWITGYQNRNLQWQQFYMNKSFEIAAEVANEVSRYLGRLNQVQRLLKSWDLELKSASNISRDKWEKLDVSFHTSYAELLDSDSQLFDLLQHYEPVLAPINELEHKLMDASEDLTDYFIGNRTFGLSSFESLQSDKKVENAHQIIKVHEHAN